MTRYATPLATNFYYSGFEKYVKGDCQEVNSDCSNSILINLQYAGACTNRGLIKNQLGDANGFCGDVKKEVSLGTQPPAQ